MIDNEALNHGLSLRQSKIQKTRDYLNRTQVIFDAFGSHELKHSQAKFAELSKALDSGSQVLLVVIGEFSRGKSSLVNALLGINLLRSAQEATTAINTFVKALPEDRTERFIRIHFQDDRAAQEIAWTDEAVLERWSTELDASHAEARKAVDYIEIFTPHPLLEKGLVLIDTPGLQSINQHHEEVTQKAIAEAHIAVWVQSTQQLGGNATEWKFLSKTIRTHFRKFITVVNMWDAVLEPTDPQEKIKPEALRVREKMDKVKQNFKANLSDQDDADLELLINADHLMGVSAIWGLGDDPVKKARSGVDRLAARIGEMFTSGEAFEQIYLKPLQQLSHIQDNLLESFTDELAQLNSAESNEERQRDLDLFDQEIKNLELEMKTATQAAREEHHRVAKAIAKDIENELITPLADMKSDIELQINARYIESLIVKKKKNVLPADLQAKFYTVTHQVTEQWEQQKQRLSDTLEGLRAEYSERMQKHAKHLKASLSSTEVSLPALDVSFDLDFSVIEAHHAKAIELENEIQTRTDEIDKIESQKSVHSASTVKLQMAQHALDHQTRQMEALGSQPAPRVGQKSVKVKEGGMYSDDKYRTEDTLDYSNVTAWKEDLERQQSMLADKEKRMQDIAKDEEHKTGVRMTLEATQRKYEKELAVFERKQKQAEQDLASERKNMVDDALRQLIQGTAGQLDQRIRYLKKHAEESIQSVFFNQMELLEDCVQEQFMEPLNAKRAKRGEVQRLMQQGQAEISLRQNALKQAQENLLQLQTMTRSALSA